MKLRFLAIFSVFLFLPALLFSQQQSETTETLSITTYYPSPYGVYNLFHLQPNDQNTPGASCANPGEIYYDASDNKPYGCMADSSGSGNTWQEIGGSGCTNFKSLPLNSSFNVTVARNSPNIPVADYTPANYTAVTLNSIPAEDNAARFAMIFVYALTPEREGNDGYMLFIDPSGAVPQEIGRVGARAMSPNVSTYMYDGHQHDSQAEGSGLTQTHHHGAFAIVPLVNRGFYIALQDYYKASGTQGITIYPVGYVM